MAQTAPVSAGVPVTVEVSAEEGTRVGLSRARIVGAARTALRARQVRHAMLSIAFVSPRRIARINRRHLGHRGSTDVIAFGLERVSRGDPVIGDR